MKLFKIDFHIFIKGDDVLCCLFFWHKLDTTSSHLEKGNLNKNKSDGNMRNSMGHFIAQLLIWSAQPRMGCVPLDKCPYGV